MRAGEILGLAGLVGAGRTELARVLFGLTPADAGEILLRGRPRARSPRPADAVGAGIAYVPEDRRRHGVILEMPVAANITLAVARPAVARVGPRLRPRAGARRSTTCGGSRSRRPSIDAPVATLSGGNQQKVALAAGWRRSRPC